MTKPRKSGASIPESQRHTVKVQLRLTKAATSALDELRKPAGRSAYIEQTLLTLYAAVAVGSHPALKPTKVPAE